MFKKLNRVVLEVFGGCNYTCQMCPQTIPGRDVSLKQKISLENFEKILDKLTPQYGHPQINLEGSGEPTMAKDLNLYVRAVKKRNLKCFMYTNGFRLHGDFMKSIIDEGIDFIRVSLIGYNKETYKKWMNSNNFEIVMQNILNMKEYVKISKSNCELSTYHLIIDNNEINNQVENYKKNIIDVLGVKSYIWRMHNWSGNFDNPLKRSHKEKKSCGRPLSPTLTIRAGGINNKRYGAIVPCCQTLGPPNEIKSILGHLDNSSLEEVYNDKAWSHLRKAHMEKKFDEIDYCKDCDFLFDDPEVLVWSNDKSAKTNHMLGTKSSEDLRKYIKVE